MALGSFGRAARKLNTTQPAISQRIAQLESELSVRLLQRDSRAVASTPGGRQMMLYAEKLISLRAEILAAVHVPALTFAASWLAAPDTLAAELVADLPVKRAQGEDYEPAEAAARGVNASTPAHPESRLLLRTETPARSPR